MRTRSTPWREVRAGAAFVGAVWASLAACSGNGGTTPGGNAPDASGTSDAAPGSDAADAALDCTPAPGTPLSPSCNDVPVGCPDPASSCTAQPCNTASPCLSLADNSGKSVRDFRMRKVHVGAPPTLRLGFVQGTLIDQNVNLQAACCEAGDGGFNVLVRLDTTAKTFTLGGGPPSADPTGGGYCFVNTTASGLSIAPVTAGASLAADGTWQSAIFSQPFNIPIFVHGVLSNLVILPVTDARLQEVTISTDGNCVGAYNEVPGCQRWATAGTLSGLITLEDADRVPIPDLGGASLCTLLLPQTGTTCARDANNKIIGMGDFCSLTDAPATADCADSMWLSVAFAASAVTINDGTGVAECIGSADASSDAAPE
jgi:hypothetical protein